MERALPKRFRGFEATAMLAESPARDTQTHSLREACASAAPDRAAQPREVDVFRVPACVLLLLTSCRSCSLEKKGGTGEKKKGEKTTSKGTSSFIPVQYCTSNPFGVFFCFFFSLSPVIDGFPTHPSPSLALSFIYTNTHTDVPTKQLFD